LATAALALLAVWTALMVVVLLSLPRVLAPRKVTDPQKVMPYESGMDPVGDARRRFDVRFYLVALVFLIFDVELVFLYPWAVAAWSDRDGLPDAAKGAGAPWLPQLVFAEVVVFVALLFLAFGYAWRKGVFDWR
jgi:NADH-quinone oxidoreductase subunit A